MCKAKWRFRTGLPLVLFIFLNGWGEQVQSQEAYPTRPIDIIVGYGPGGSTDLTSRITAAYLRKKWNVAVNVINKPGGNTVPANLEVYNAAPDGYTLLGDPPGSSSMVGIVVRNLPFKVMDRTFVSLIAASTMCITVPSNSTLKSLKDIVDEAKKAPEYFTWNSSGGTGTADLTMRQFTKAIGVDILKTKAIVTSGSGATAVLVAGSNIKMGITTVSACIPLIQAGMIRPLAVTSDERWPTLPNVPTAVELGYPTVRVLSWTGITGPPKLPSYIVDKWSVAIRDMVKDPEIISQLTNTGSIPYYKNAQAFREEVTKEIREVEELWHLK